MDILFVLLGLVPIFFLGAVFYLLVSHSRLKSRVSELEQSLSAHRSQMPAEPAPIQPPPKASKAEVPREKPEVFTSPWERPRTADSDDAVLSGPVSKPAKDETVAQKTQQSFVFKKENIDAVRGWFAKNWFLAIAALSLALAGVYLVQYGVENGIVTPFWRVISAAVLGIALIWGGEFVRRNFGDNDSSHTAYLPSTFSGAGLVSLFSSVLAARQLYGLISPEGAFVWLLGVCLVAIYLGWFYGPFLTVVGILGSTAAPFLVGGESEGAQLYYYYFAIIAISGLLVDAVKRWAWVSVFSLIFTFAAAWYIFDAGAGDQHFLAFALIVGLGAVAIPPLMIVPQHAGVSISQALLQPIKGGGEFPAFPTRIAAGGFWAGAVAVFFVALNDKGQAEVWLAIASLVLMVFAAVVWMRRAPALVDLALVPAILFLGIIFLQAADQGSIYSDFLAGVSRAPESSPPMWVSGLAALAFVITGLAFWRCLWPGSFNVAWAGLAALFAPLALVLLEAYWAPSAVMGAAEWATHAMIIAAAMVLFADRVSRRDGSDHRRVAIFALSALTMICFALIVVLSSTALTLALAVMVLAAALIDHRLDLRLLTVLMQVGVIIVGWRLLFDPGLGWADNAPIWEVVFAYGGVVALLAASWLFLHRRARLSTMVVVESGACLNATLLMAVLLYRALGAGGFDSHWGVSLLAVIWLAAALVQIYRLKAGGPLRWLRIGLAVVYSLLFLLLMILLFTVQNPLFDRNQIVLGPLVFDSLLVAYGLPALVLGVAALRFPNIHKRLRISFVGLAAFFAITYAGFEIRRFWQGNTLAVSGVLDGEMYSYTVAMLLGAVGTLFLAFSRRSKFLRRVAIIGIGLTIAKVFFLDTSGLGGLYRVASFLGLGLSLAGLAWLDRRMSAQWDDRSHRAE